MVKDHQTHMPLLMMGLLSILTHFISAGLQLSNTQSASSGTDVKDQLMWFASLFFNCSVMIVEPFWKLSSRVDLSTLRFNC